MYVALILLCFVFPGAQLLISLITGIPNRITDIDDMLLNLVGGLCGYLAFYQIFRVIRKGKTI